MNRRSFLSTAAAATTVAVAGCLGSSPPGRLSDAEEDPDQLPTPTLGDGPVALDVYEDPGCPACQEFARSLLPVIRMELIEEGFVTYSHVDYILPAAETSIDKGNAARSVQDQTGGDGDPNGSFFEYKSAVFDANSPGRETLAELAADHGADPDVVATDLEEETYFPTLAADWRRGEEHDVDSTPTVLVDGTAVEEPMNGQAIFDAVVDAL